MVENEALDLEIRRKIYEHIRKSPGLHLRELSRLLETPLSTLDYHLYYLKQRGLIHDSQDGGYTRYYLTGDIGVKEKNVLSVLRQRVPRTIIMFLLLHPNSPHGDISTHIQLAPSTTSFHLKKLMKLEIIMKDQIGKEVSYHIKDAAHISDLLITYKTTFLDASVDRFLETWLQVNPDHIRKPITQDDEKK
jgi:predicted transcriptional regulator